MVMKLAMQCLAAFLCSFGLQLTVHGYPITAGICIFGAINLITTYSCKADQ
jgi:hypothetical protein